MRSKQINLESEGVMADVCLGVAVTGLYTLVGMGLVIVFMWKAVQISCEVPPISILTTTLKSVRK
jgi:hypothetical protein